MSLSTHRNDDGGVFQLVRLPLRDVFVDARPGERPLRVLEVVGRGERRLEREALPRRAELPPREVRESGRVREGGGRVVGERDEGTPHGERLAAGVHDVRVDLREKRRLQLGPGRGREDDQKRGEGPWEPDAHLLPPARGVCLTTD